MARSARRGRLFHSTCLVVGLMFAAPAEPIWAGRHATTQASAPPLVVPFHTTRGNLVTVHGAIGHIDDLQFLVDTGTSRTVIDARLRTGLHDAVQDRRVECEVVDAERLVEVRDARGQPVRQPARLCLSSVYRARRAVRRQGLLVRGTSVRPSAPPVVVERIEGARRAAVTWRASSGAANQRTADHCEATATGDRP